MRTPLAGEHQAANCAFSLVAARRRAASPRDRLDARQSRLRARAPSRALPARRTLHLRRRAQPGRARRCSRRRSPRVSRRRRSPSCSASSRQGLARDDRALAPRRSTLRRSPMRRRRRRAARGTSARRAAFARELGFAVEAEPDFDRGARVARARAAGRRSSQARFTLSATRWRVAGVSARRVALRRMSQGALPGFRDFYPRTVRRARVTSWVCGATLRGGSRSSSTTGPARAARAVHEEERRRDRRPALQLHGQGRARGRAAARDDADASRAWSPRARTRCASRCAGSRCRSSSATSASSKGGCASTFS